MSTKPGNIYKKSADKKDVAADTLLIKIKQLEDINHMMAHNLRGAASSIKMISDFLLDSENETGTPGDEAPEMSNATAADILTLHDALESINISSDRLLCTLGSMMENIEKRMALAIQPGECDIKEVAEHVKGQLVGLAKKKHARIVYDLDVKHVNYARVYLESYFYNFMSNSLKYARPDVPPEINIITYQKRGRTILEVQDNGLGIDLNKYGNQLFGLHQVFHEGYDSKGVGLYMTRQQIESQGGAIKVKSKVNEGTSFIVTL